jgi:hypothetical protein
MKTLGRGMFDVYALALPRGHGFGERLPHEAWQSGDGKACAIVTRHAEDGSIGLIVMRRRADGVWAVTLDNAPGPMSRPPPRSLSANFRSDNHHCQYRPASNAGPRSMISRAASRARSSGC